MNYPLGASLDPRAPWAHQEPTSYRFLVNVLAPENNDEYGEMQDHELEVYIDCIGRIEDMSDYEIRRLINHELSMEFDEYDLLDYYLF
jgi:hypothetical protein